MDSDNGSDASDVRNSGRESRRRSRRSETPPRKSRKRHYDQKYSKSWEKDKEYAGWLQGSTKGDEYFYCKACRCDLKCAGGRFILNKHANSSKHIANVKGTVNQLNITQFGQSQSKKSFEDKIKTGEIRMACFLAKNNLPFNIAGDLKTLIQDVCPDSEIAKELKFDKTKAHAIITNVTGKLSHSDLVETLKTERFSLIVDESTDKSTTKHLALIARTAVDFKVEDNFLCLIPIVDGTASALHDKCKQYFDNHNIPYKQNMIGFAADGANTMFGHNHSLSTLFTSEIPNLFLMKCICHSFHLCASYACKTLPRGVEDFARDVYNYIQNSPKRLGDYEEFQSFMDVKPHKLLHPAQTRWLSLLPVVKRLLEQLPALQLYFQNAVLNDRLLAAQAIHIKSVDPSTELFLNFLDFVLPFFHDINKEMQSESPKLYLLYERVFTLYKTIMECFIKPDLLQLTEGEKSSSRNETLDLENKILSLDYENKINHLPIEEVYLGGKVQFLLLKPGFIAKINEMEIIQFKEKCLLFYMESLKQINQRFCFRDKQILKSLAFMNTKHLIEKNAVPSIANIGIMFPGLFPDIDNLTELDREWRLLRNKTFPYTEKNTEPTPEEFWKHVSLIKKGDESPMFPLLCQIVRKLLVLPHSSANVERLFSSINNMKTSQRNKLCTDTLEGLLHTKRFIVKRNGQPSAEHLKLFNVKMYKHKHTDI